MKKRILITCTDLMMQQFLLPHVNYLRAKGCDVTIACSNVGGKLEALQKTLTDVPVRRVRLRRSPLWPGNLLGYFDLKKHISSGIYDIVWTNEPVMGVLTRLAARNSGAKVLYLCHGFHFYRGGTLLNWLLWYPVEYLMSELTDLLVTINREDAAVAEYMLARRTAYIHGIGLNTARLEKPQGDIRRELGLGKSDYLLVSVGELNKNKDHATALRAMALLEDPHIHYALCGRGPLRGSLEHLAKKLGIEKRVHFMGYRRDLSGIFAGADLMLHPSRREGLGLAAMEGKYCGLPLVASDIRGIRDFAGQRDLLVPPGDAAAFARAIREQQTAPGRCPWEPGDYRLEAVQEKIWELLESL